MVAIRLGVISDGQSHESCSTQSWVLTVLHTRSQSMLNRIDFDENENSHRSAYGRLERRKRDMRRRGIAWHSAWIKAMSRLRAIFPFLRLDLPVTL